MVSYLKCVICSLSPLSAFLLHLQDTTRGPCFMRSFVSISSKNNFSWKIGSFGNSELIYGRTCLEVHRWFHALLLSKIPTVLFPTPRLSPVLWSLVLCFFLHTDHFVHLRYLHFSLQPPVYSWCLSRSLKNAIWSTPMKHWPSVSFLSVIFCPIHMHTRAGTRRVNRVGLVLGLPPGKGLLCTVVLCARASHLSGVIHSLCKDQRSVEL